MLTNITYYLILGKPLIMYIGILTLLLLLSTATLGFMIFRGIGSVDIKWHHRMAVTTLCIEIIHATLGILAYF